MSKKIRADVAFRLHMEKVTEATWFTKDERRVHVRHMRDGHLVNTIRLVRRWAQAALLAETMSMLLGPRPNGEAARDAFDEEVSHLSTARPDDYAAAGCPCWARMLEEAKARRLDASGFFDPSRSRPHGGDGQLGLGALDGLPDPLDEKLDHEDYRRPKS